MRARWFRIAGLAMGLVAGGLALRAPLGLGSALAVPVFAVFLLAGVLGAELLVARPAGVTRVAIVEVRRARSYLPRTATRVVAFAGAALIALLAAAAFAAGPDDLGRAGRALTLTCEDSSSAMSSGGSSSASPWPGVYYGLPVGLAVLAGLVVSALAVRAITRRPRSAPGEIDADDSQRRASAGAVVSAAGLLVSVPLAGLALVAGGAMITVADGPCPAPEVSAAGWVLVAAGLAAGVTACVFVARLIMPRVS